MSAPPPTPATPSPAPEPRRRPWMLVPLMLLLFVLITVVWAYLRGTSAETEEHNPNSATDPPVSQLHRSGSGHTAVRAAVIIAQPRQKVWEVVSDFDRYGDVLGDYVRDVKATKNQDGTWAVKGEAKALFSGYWTFEMTARAENEQGRPWRLWWQEQGDGEVRLNRGAWTLTELTPNETLLALELEAEVKGAPTWVLRNFFLYRLREAVAAVKKHVEAKKE